MRFRLIVDKTKEEEIVAIVHEKTELIERIEKLVSGTASCITLYGDKCTRILEFSEIECIFALDGKTYAVASDGKRYRVKMRLYEAERLLPTDFFRINKSAIANKDRLERFTVSFSGAVDAVFKSGYKDYVSRRCLAEIKRRFNIE